MTGPTRAPLSPKENVVNEFHVLGEKHNFLLINFDKVESIRFEKTGGSAYKAFIRYFNGSRDEIEITDNQATELIARLNLSI